MIQGGDGEHGKKASLNPSRVGTGGPGYKFDDEPITGDYYRGTLAMANSGPNTNGSQFFICHQDLVGKLPKNYTIFGQVTKGLDVVDAIANAPRNAPGPAGRAGRNDLRHGARRGLSPRKLARIVKGYSPKRPYAHPSRIEGPSLGWVVLQRSERCPSIRIMGRLG